MVNREFQMSRRDFLKISGLTAASAVLSACGSSGDREGGQSAPAEQAPASAPTATMPQAWERKFCASMTVEKDDSMLGLANKAREKYPELSNLSENDVSSSMHIENTHIPDWNKIKPGDILKFCDYENE